MLYVRIFPPVSTGSSFPAFTHRILIWSDRARESPADALIPCVALPAAEGSHEVNHGLSVLQQRLYASVRRRSVTDHDDICVAQRVRNRRAHHRPDVRNLLLDKLLV